MSIRAMLKPMYKRVRMEFGPYGFFRNYVLFPITAFLRKNKILFYKPYDKIEKFKDRHKGKRCFIVATGPSLDLEDVSRLKDEIIFSMNTGYKVFQKLGWKPTYYSMTDPELHKHLNKEQALDFDSYATDAVFINALNRKITDSQKAIFINNCWLDHVYHYGTSKHFKYNPDLLWGVYDFYSITQELIILAIYMGFKDIYIIGADNDYLGKKQHFDSVKGEVNLDYEKAVKAQNANDMGYEEVKRISELMRVNVYNATRGGKVECFKRVKLEDVV